MWDSKWFGLSFNFKWPHEGFVFGFSYDFFDWEESIPWSSVAFRIAFLTIVADFGYGEDSKEIYNNRIDFNE